MKYRIYVEDIRGCYPGRISGTVTQIFAYFRYAKKLVKYCQKIDAVILSLLRAACCCCIFRYFLFHILNEVFLTFINKIYRLNAEILIQYHWLRECGLIESSGIKIECDAIDCMFVCCVWSVWSVKTHASSTLHFDNRNVCASLLYAIFFFQVLLLSSFLCFMLL